MLESCFRVRRAGQISHSRNKSLQQTAEISRNRDESGLFASQDSHLMEGRQACTCRFALYQKIGSNRPRLNS